jgi:hypothetical protein
MTQEAEAIAFLRDAKSRSLLPSEMLQGLVVIAGDNKPYIMYGKYFSLVFNIPFIDCGMVLGWQGFGRDISSKDIDEFFYPLIYEAD